MAYHLAIGDRSYSSWSLRGWLMFVKFGLAPKVRRIRLFTPDFTAALADFPGTRLVPAVRFEAAGREVALWDTIAIAETLAERHPDRGFWPEEAAARVLARSMAAEMHSGFAALRGACPMNLRRAYDGFAPTEAVLADLARIEALWAMARGVAGDGPWLFGAYSLADAFFAPVAMRIAGYGLPVGAAAEAYVAAHLGDADFRRWRAMGFAEGEGQARYDLDLPRRPWPGPVPLPARAVTGARAENATCPFSGDPVVADSLAEVGGRVIGFCNPFCRDKVVADPEAWPAAMALLGR